MIYLTTTRPIAYLTQYYVLDSDYEYHFGFDKYDTVNITKYDSRVTFTFYDENRNLIQKIAIPWHWIISIKENYCNEDMEMQV